MRRRSSLAALLLAAAGCAWAEGFSAVLVEAARLTPAFLDSQKRAGYNAVVLAIGEAPAAQESRAAQAALAAGWPLYYWIEIGRNPALADRHPEWMASLQGHPEWRRFFPGVRAAGAGEVIKNYPWTPVLYKEAFDAHLRHVEELLGNRPSPRGIFLNDLQGAPSACGCGNSLCRWTSDYGPLTTSTRLPASAAADFLAAVRRLAPRAAIIPVWTTECEEQDKAQMCAGVACFTGLCWRELTAQLMPVAAASARLGVLLTYRELGRDIRRYGTTAGWIRHAVASLAEMPPRRGGSAIPAGRLIAVLQGWDVTEVEVRAQLDRGKEAGVAGTVVSRVKIGQSWTPRLLKTGAPYSTR